ncbi:MAG: glycoside hydrolase family 3 N-terminal domain-containing protein [Rubrobacteraceae bacterium]
MESTVSEKREASRESDNSTTVESTERESVSEEIDRMDLRALVGQMFVVSVSGTESDYYIDKMIRERNIGGVLLFGYNMQNEAQTRALVDSLQSLAVNTEPALPLFVAVDQEGGEISSAPWVTPQPAAAEVGARGDPSEARRIAEQIGSELRRAGINTDFAPVVDTGFGAAIGTRSYGEDPSLVSQMGAASVEGFEAAGVVSAAKHFPNHGVAAVDSHVGFPVVEHDMPTILSYDLPPFRAAVRAGVPMVMVGHLIYPAIAPERPASLSPRAIQLLREELNFDGIVVSDDLSMAGASGGESPAEATVAAVKAGVDLVIVSSPAQEQADAYEAIVSAVEADEIPRERIEQSVRRIVEVKRNYPIYGGA